MSGPTRLRDLDDDLGAAFRSADRDVPRPAAKAALMAALGVGAATLATASTVSATAATAATASGAGAAAGGSTAAVGVAKGAGMAVIAKWLIASAVVVSGAAATVHVVSPSEPVRAVPQHASVSAPSPTFVAPAQAPGRVGTESLGEPASPAPPAPVLATTTTTAEVHAAAPEPLRAAPEEAPVAHARVPAPRAPLAIITPPPLAAFATVAPAAAEESAPARRSTISVTDEIAHLDRARSLIARGRGAEAVEAIAAYRRAVPAGGVLAEEAAVLEIEALASAGQRERARSLGDRFLANRVNSPLVPRVLRATGRGEQDPRP